MYLSIGGLYFINVNLPQSRLYVSYMVNIDELNKFVLSLSLGTDLN